MAPFIMEPPVIISKGGKQGFINSLDIHVSPGEFVLFGASRGQVLDVTHSHAVIPTDQQPADCP